MPANPEQLHAALRRIGRELAAQSQADQDTQAEALRLLRQSAAESERLESAVNAAVAAGDSGLRCAIPSRENMADGYSCGENWVPRTLLAVDGSQAAPDRHQEVLFGVINIGSIILEPNSRKAPLISVDTRLLFGRELRPENGALLSEGDLALMRDGAERTSLRERASQVPSGSIALTDGPLELWGAKDASDRRAFERALQGYLENLRQMEVGGWSVAGYVDKPGADLVVRLLEIASAPSGSTTAVLRADSLQGVSDRWLFGQILEPGQRSALFALQSTSRMHYTASLAIHFFYVNVGHPGQPILARVEIPKWVADSEQRVRDLHYALLQQCAALGVRPYPYVLHRAHEIARLSMHEKEQIKLKLLLELRQHQLEPEGLSPKSSAKAASGKKGRF